MDVDFFVVVMPYTLLDTDDLDREFSLARNAGVVIGDLFVSGILATGTMPDTRAMTMRHGRPADRGAVPLPLRCNSRSVTLRWPL